MIKILENIIQKFKSFKYSSPTPEDQTFFVNVRNLIKDLLSIGSGETVLILYEKPPRQGSTKHFSKTQLQTIQDQLRTSQDIFHFMQSSCKFKTSITSYSMTRFGEPSKEAWDQVYGKILSKLIRELKEDRKRHSRINITTKLYHLAGSYSRNVDVVINVCYTPLGDTNFRKVFTNIQKGRFISIYNLTPSLLEEMNDLNAKVSQITRYKRSVADYDTISIQNRHGTFLMVHMVAKDRVLFHKLTAFTPGDFVEFPRDEMFVVPYHGLINGKFVGFYLGIRFVAIIEHGLLVDISYNERYVTLHYSEDVLNVFLEYINNLKQLKDKKTPIQYIGIGLRQVPTHHNVEEGEDILVEHKHTPTDEDEDINENILMKSIGMVRLIFSETSDDLEVTFNRSLNIASTECNIFGYHTLIKAPELCIKGSK